MPASVVSETELFQMALDLLVENVVVSANQNHPSVKWMARNYPRVRDALLRAHNWNFAIKRAALAADAVAPAFEWQRSFTLPPDCIRALPITQDGTKTGRPVLFEKEGNKILTSKSAPLLVRYVSRITNVSEFDASFVNVLIYDLAMQAAHFITGKASLMERLQAGYERAWTGATLMDSLESPMAPAESNDIIDARQ